MKRNLFAIFLAMALVVALVFVVAPSAKAEDTPTKITPDKVLTKDGEEINVDSDMLLDLAGHNATVNVDAGVTLSVIDTGNTKLDGTCAGTLTVSNESKGRVVGFEGLYDGTRFLKVATGSNTYSFHPCFVQIEEIGVNTSKSALCLKITYVTNKAAQKAVESGVVYGVNPDAMTSAADTFGAFEFEGAVLTAYFDLVGSLDTADSIKESRTFQAYIKSGDQTVANFPIEITPETVLINLNEKANTNKFDDTQKAKMKAMIEGKAHLEALCPNFLGKQPEAEPVEVTLDFTNAANRTSSSTTQQIWEQNGITLTYDKNNYNNNLAEYSPVRFYAGTLVTIEFKGMTTLVFDCVDNSYASAMASSITGVNVICDGTKVTVELTEASNSFAFSPTTQTRVKSLTISNAPLCAHEGGKATCVERAKCEFCNNYYGSVSENHTDTNYDHICDIEGCGNTMVGECIDGADADSLCDYGANHADGCKKDFNSTVKTPYSTTISFANTTNRVSQDSNAQVWRNGEVTFTNNKASSSNPVGNYSNPVRLYQGSTVKIEASGMTKIEIVSDGTAKYKTALQNSLSGAGIKYTSSGSTYTITLDSVDSIEFSLTAQARFKSITVSGNK